MSVLSNNLGWIIAGVIVVVGLFIFGLSDLLRSRPRRVMAIAGVCFAESIRRRILWITPLAILGVIVVASLQKPFDEQDAIRQITKFCIFATGLVVVISTMILACTNLPREIENRVIFTVVTKPTTRLEIVLGKIVGFSEVSAAILIIMGIFTWGYLNLRASALEHDIKARLEANSVEPISRPALQHYVDAGLLNAKTFATAASMQMFSRLPDPHDPRRYFAADNTALIPFTLPADTAAAVDPQSASYKGPGLILHLRIGYDQVTAPKAAATQAMEVTGPTPLISSTRPAAATGPSGPVMVSLSLFDPNQASIAGADVNGGKPFALSGSPTDLEVPLTVTTVNALLKSPYFYVGVFPGTDNVQYWIDDHPGQAIVPLADKPTPLTLAPMGPAMFTGRQGTYGQQQLKGGPAATAPVCIYSFHDVDTYGITGKIPLELRSGIERNGDEPSQADAPTDLQVQVRNSGTGVLTDAGLVNPENNRIAYASVPAEAMAGGNFEIILRCLTPGHWVGLTPASLSLVRAEDSFAFNLFKSMFILWLLTVLVIAVSVFCSTFLSWPIAVVLTLVILLGRWGVEEVGDAASAGLGRQFVQDFGVRDPAQAQALSSTVEQLNKLLAVVAAVLPDINQFSATDDIERGVSVPVQQLTDALVVVVGFGLPLTVLAYIFLKNKEVAP